MYTHNLFGFEVSMMAIILYLKTKFVFMSGMGRGVKSWWKKHHATDRMVAAEYVEFLKPNGFAVGLAQQFRLENMDLAASGLHDAFAAQLG
jgi:hypothetical protein